MSVVALKGLEVTTKPSPRSSHNEMDTATSSHVNTLLYKTNRDEPSFCINAE